MPSNRDVSYRKPSQREWRDLATGREIRGSLMSVGQKGKSYAEARAAEFSNTGHYASSFDLVESSTIWAGHYRAEVRLQNDSDYATVLELKYHPVLHETLEYLQSTGRG